MAAGVNIAKTNIAIGSKPLGVFMSKVNIAVASRPSSAWAVISKTNLAVASSTPSVSRRQLQMVN